MFRWKKKKALNEEVDFNALPEHIAIIMDGNGRWAKKRGLPRSAGHSAGSDALQDLTEYADSIGLKYLTVYAFSTENWKRPKEEVDALMKLMMHYLNDTRRLAGKNVKISFIGDLSVLSEDAQQKIKVVEDMTRERTGTNLLVALNYGGRDEMVSAVRKIAAEVKDGSLQPADITEKHISDRIYTAGIPDPELIIRTSGEYRLSNFLMWQSVYSEFWFTDVLWPDFKGEHLLAAIRDFQHRNRRFGNV